VTLWNDGVEPCEITLRISDPPGSHQRDLLICSDGCAFWSGEGSAYENPVMPIDRVPAR